MNSRELVERGKAAARAPASPYVKHKDRPKPHGAPEGTLWTDVTNGDLWKMEGGTWQLYGEIGLEYGTDQYHDYLINGLQMNASGFITRDQIMLKPIREMLNG